MAEPITFFVAGEPKGQPRQRHGTFQRRDGTIGSRNYSGGQADDWISLVASEAKRHRPTAMIRGGVRVDIEFVFTRPKGHWTARGALTKSAPLHHIKKPDRDNLDKCILDLLTKLGFWADDNQAVQGQPSKRWAQRSEDGVDEPQGAHVRIVALEPQAERPGAQVTIREATE